MKSQRILILAIGFFIVPIAGFAVGFYMSRSNFPATDAMLSKPPELGPRQDVSGLTAKNLQDREKAAEAIRKQRAELIKKLVGFAAEKVKPLPSSDPRFIEYPWHDSKHLATLLLGNLRATEAVPVLLENIEYKNPRTMVVDEPLGSGGWYPAAEALSKIGMPAIPPTIDNLGTYDTNCLGRQLCCWVIKEILGPRLGKVRLEMAIEESREPAAKENLTAALRHFKAEWQSAAK
jgi:hypothetical protein